MMRMFILLLLGTCNLSLIAQGFDPSKPLPIQSLEKTYEDSEHTVVHFATNRLLLKEENRPGFDHIYDPHLNTFVAAGKDALYGWARVKHVPAKEAENTAALNSFKIEYVKEAFKIRISETDENPQFKNEILKEQSIRGEEILRDGSDHLQNLWRRNVLIFVHGFNNDFETAIKRAAQLKRDIVAEQRKTNPGYDLSILVFSWPSLGGEEIFGINGAVHYRDDERRFRESIPAVARFLKNVLAKFHPADANGPKRLSIEGRGERYILAHSMGNRVLLNSFAYLIDCLGKNQVHIPPNLVTRAVFAAPDKEINEFVEGVATLQRYSLPRTRALHFHAASNIAIQASEIANDDERAGLHTIKNKNIISVDATSAKSPWTELGHGYYASNDLVVRMISNYIAGKLDPEKEPGLEVIDSEGAWRVK